jgi:hypothetical protein
LGDVFESIVTATASLGTKPDGPDRKMEVVDDNQQIARREVVVLTERGDGVSASIHEGERLGETNLLIFVLGPGHLRIVIAREGGDT